MDTCRETERQQSEREMFGRVTVGLFILQCEKNFNFSESGRHEQRERDERQEERQHRKDMSERPPKI